MSQSLYETVQANGIEHDNHESDLYLPDTAQVREILERFPDKKEISSGFIHQVKRQQWIEIPFAYQPWWEKRQETQPAHNSCNHDYIHQPDNSEVCWKCGDTKK